MSPLTPPPNTPSIKSCPLPQVKYRLFRYLNALHYVAYARGCAVDRMSIKAIAKALQESGLLVKNEAEVMEG